MYLSRVEIDFNNRQKTKDLNHLGSYHNWVEQLFPFEIEKGERSRKLWRVDTILGKHFLLVLSESKPDLESFNTYGVPNTAEVKDYKSFLNKLQNDQIVRFKATLNPVKSLSSGKASGRRGRVVPHVTVQQKMDYLIEKAKQNGFELKENDFYISKSNFHPLKRSGNKMVQISKVTYEGFLTITDVVKFRETLCKGLGKKRAYGCGLITVIPEK